MHSSAQTSPAAAKPTPALVRSPAAVSVAAGESKMDGVAQWAESQCVRPSSRFRALVPHPAAARSRRLSAVSNGHLEPLPESQIPPSSPLSAVPQADPDEDADADETSSFSSSSDHEDDHPASPAAAATPASTSAAASPTIDPARAAIIETRRKQLLADPLLTAVESDRVFCTACGRTVKLGAPGMYHTSNWYQHRARHAGQVQRGLDRERQRAERARLRAREEEARAAALAAVAAAAGPLTPSRPAEKKEVWNTR
jgi:hypothetical protein